MILYVALALSVVVNIMFLLWWACLKKDVTITRQTFETKWRMASNVLQSIVVGYAPVEYKFIEFEASNLCMFMGISPTQSQRNALEFLRRYETERKKFLQDYQQKHATELHSILDYH